MSSSHVAAPSGPGSFHRVHGQSIKQFVLHSFRAGSGIGFWLWVLGSRSGLGFGPGHTHDSQRTELTPWAGAIKIQQKIKLECNM